MNANEVAQVEGRAKYFSTNNNQQKSFYAEAPAGSKHAARLQRLCAIVDPDAQRNLKQDHLQEANEGQLVQTRHITEATTVPPHQPVEVGPMQNRNTSPQRAPAKIYRYERGGEVGYLKKSSRGETFMSAPKGSMEARTMDQAAQLRATSTVRCDIHCW